MRQEPVVHLIAFVFVELWRQCEQAPHKGGTALGWVDRRPNPVREFSAQLIVERDVNVSGRHVDEALRGSRPSVESALQFGALSLRCEEFVADPTT